MNIMAIKTTLKVVLICVICAVTLLAGCLDSDVHTKESTEIIETTPNEIIVVEEIASPTTEMTPAAIPTPTPAPAVPTEIDLSIGEIATDSRVEVTVISVSEKYYYEYMGYSGVRSEDAAHGNTFIIADVNMKNVGDERSYLGSHDLSVTDSNGYRYDSSYYHGDDGLESIQELYQNQQMEGVVVFEVPNDATGLKIQYDFGSVFGETEIASWAID